MKAELAEDKAFHCPLIAHSQVRNAMFVFQL